MLLLGRAPLMRAPVSAPAWSRPPSAAANRSSTRPRTTTSATSSSSHHRGRRAVGLRLITNGTRPRRATSLPAVGSHRLPSRYSTTPGRPDGRGISGCRADATSSASSDSGGLARLADGRPGARLSFLRDRPDMVDASPATPASSLSWRRARPTPPTSILGARIGPAGPAESTLRQSVVIDRFLRRRFRAPMTREAALNSISTGSLPEGLSSPLSNRYYEPLLRPSVASQPTSASPRSSGDHEGRLRRRRRSFGLDRSRPLERTETASPPSRRTRSWALLASDGSPVWTDEFRGLLSVLEEVATVLPRSGFMREARPGAAGRRASPLPTPSPRSDVASPAKRDQVP